MTKHALDVKWVRKQFPALENDMIFMDNAGGSQTLSTVMDRITDYLTNYDVQHGASYSTSQNAVEQLTQAKQEIQKWLNADCKEEVIIGASSTMLLRILSLCISQKWQKGDEVIITNCDHEANMTPWKDLQKQGMVIKVWNINPKTYRLELDDLMPLLSQRTQMVAVTHVSNILGTINPIRAIADTVHEFDALICVDAVAYAPHRAIDVQDLGVDFYVFSTYKTFGPHQAIMYGRYDILQDLPGINHGFIDEVPYKFLPGNCNFELAYSLAAIPQYIEQLGSGDISQGYQNIAIHEQHLASLLLNYLNNQQNVTVIGEASADRHIRVSTIAFIHHHMNSDEIVKAMDVNKIGIRYGDFYAVDLIDDLGLREKGGVVRVSLVHYNTIAEVEKLISHLKNIL